MTMDKVFAMLWLLFAIAAMVLGSDKGLIIGIICSQMWAVGIYYGAGRQ